MKMEYKLLKKNRGVILTRQPELIKDELLITFAGAPDKATAIFDNGNGDSLYRLLEDGSCAVPATFLTGETRVTVTLLNGAANAPKWACEGIKGTETKGGVFVCPNDMDVPSKITDVLIAQDEITDQMSELMKKYSELEIKLNKLLEGYDIT